MSTTYFRRPTYRAPSPPTWACYEQIPYGGGDYSDSDSESDSCSSCGSSEDDSDAEYAAARLAVDPTRASDDDNDGKANVQDSGADDVPNMDLDEAGDAEKREEESLKKDVKGKQRAQDPSPEEVMESPKKRSHRRRRREPAAPALRPILTIHKSQGFVWNQDLFVPPYAKDRYVASTSPSSGNGFLPGSWSSTASSLGTYEVEVVEIRVEEGELDHIISH